MGNIFGNLFGNSAPAQPMPTYVQVGNGVMMPMVPAQLQQSRGGLFPGFGSFLNGIANFLDGTPGASGLPHPYNYGPSAVPMPPRSTGASRRGSRPAAA